jgi:tubulin polyglutamylase TTLL11
LKPWLLEINGNPSLNIEHELDQPIDKKKPETVVSPIDKFVKEKVIEDAILISRKKVKKQMSIKKYGSFELIYNSEDSQYAEKKLFKDILNIFGNLSGTRFKTHLTSSKFIKLASIPGMISEKFSKADYDIMYRKLVQQAEDKQMNFPTFIKALEAILTKLNPNLSEENRKDTFEQMVTKLLLCS